LNLAKAARFTEILAGMRMIAEGVGTTAELVSLAREAKVELPITEQCGNSHQGKPPREAIRDIMERPNGPNNQGSTQPAPTGRILEDRFIVRRFQLQVRDSAACIFPGAPLESLKIESKAMSAKQPINVKFKPPGSACAPGGTHSLAGFGALLLVSAFPIGLYHRQVAAT